MDINANQIETKMNVIKDFSFPNIPQSDKRKYKVITLENDMKATLISDPKTDKSAVALDVHIGSLTDPIEIQGLAHFCEHMVFMGSEKYPEENYYSKYIAQNNGGTNAYTSSENTNFFLEIHPDNLLEAMDIFAQFFIAPLFTESATDREMQAVNSEHEKNLISDAHRLYQLDKHLSDNNHCYSKFSTGNLTTLKLNPQNLGLNVRNELLKFHEKYYSSNIMNLCVLGKESIEQLENHVLKLFSFVPNKHVIVPCWNESPWTDMTLQKVVYVNPIKEQHQIHLLWPITNYSKQYRSKPDEYVCHLIGHETVGSIICHLKKLQWAENITVYSNKPADNFAALSIDIHLYEEGLKHINEIVDIVYQYINVLRSSEPEKWIFDEMKKINDIKFRFKENSSLDSYVSNLAKDMSLYSPEHIIQGPYLLTDFEPESIKTVIDCLKPSKMKMYLISKTFSDRVKSEETWYKTEYFVENIEPALINQWENVKANRALHLPHPNMFLAENFQIKSSLATRKDNGETQEEVTGPPIKIRDDSLAKWWFCQDHDYLLPKGFVFIKLSNNLSSIDPTYFVMDELLCKLFNHKLNDIIYDAYLANLVFNMFVGFFGIRLEFSGYNDKLPTFIAKVVKELANFVPDHADFESVKLSFFRKYRNFDMQRPLFQADDYLNCLSFNVKWTHQDCLSTINDVTYDNFKAYFKMFFSRFHTEGLIYGNFNEKDAESIASCVDTSFGSVFNVRPLLTGQLIIPREVLLPEDSEFVFHYTNHKQPTSAIVTYLQSDHPLTTRNNVLAKLLNKMMYEPMFDRLRTEQQLGYIVGCNIKRGYSLQGHCMMIQSMKRPDYLDQQINLFLTDYYDVLKSMSKDEFQTHLMSLHNNIIERPKDMRRKYDKLIKEITRQQYNFNRCAEEVKELNKLTQQDIMEYFEKVVKPGSQLLKKLSIYITSAETHGKEFSSEKLNDKIQIISDVVQFKKSMLLSPIYDSNVLLMAQPQPKL